MLGRRTSKLLLAVVGTLVLSAGIATAATGTLETEDLLAPADTFSSTASCSTDGTSTVSWTAEGFATGPYPGTFTLSGSLTIGPQTLPARPPGLNQEGTFAGPVTSFTETFTINSAATATTITGTKTLDPQATSGTVGTCQEVSEFAVLDFFDGQGTVVEVNTQTRYEAQIQGLAGTTTDSGIAYASLADINITGSCPAGASCVARLAGFNQTFALSDSNQPCAAQDEDDSDDSDDSDDDDECTDDDEDD